MKKILLTTLNAKYVHTNLGLWYIYQFCKKDYPEIIFKEYNINQELTWVCGEIYLEKADVVAFSCNIWNIEQTLNVCERLKAVAPDTTIILGGPEVWSEPLEIMRSHPAVDFIIIGEGELTFKEWLAESTNPEPSWSQIKGLVYRSSAGPVQNEPRPDISDLSILPSPYPEDLTGFRQKLVYYETTRGCPYQCQYCLSANERGIRYFPLDRVKSDLLRFIENEIAQVKFVDRSFNANLKWAKEIWRFILAHPGKTNFHFEIVGDLLDEESIAILAEAPPGMIQFEIGVQSTHPETLELIRRKMNFERLSTQVRELMQRTNVFVHLDLIAGLPAEDYLTFQKTFNDNLEIRPHRLQLGFLKLLHGSGLRERAAEYGYRFTREAPYEVLANHWMSYDDLLKLKVIEDLLERYYNTGRFKLTFQYLIPQYKTAFELFEQLSMWWKGRGLDQNSHKSRDLYLYLLNFYEDCGHNPVALREILKFDLLCQERITELPEWVGENNPELKQFGYDFWKNPAHIKAYLPHIYDTTGMGQTPVIRDIQRKVLFAQFKVNPETVAANPLNPYEFKPFIFLFVYHQNQTKTYCIDVN